LAVLAPWRLVLGSPPGRFDVRSVQGLGGRLVDIAAPQGGATALVFYSSECPISNAYSPTLNTIKEEFAAAKFKLVGVCVDPDLSDAEVETHARDFGLKYPVARDRYGVVAAKLGVEATPEAYVIDSQGRVRYHGRIDDQFAARQKRKLTSSTHELHDAIAAVLAGREVAASHVEAVGCPLPEPAQAPATPTYSKDVASILQKHCQECHRRGQVGPFALESYEQARKRADDIASVAEDRRMPPWKAEPGFGPKYKHDRSLSPAEIATLIAWAEGGAPQGNPADGPAPVAYNDDWKLGTPDLILEPAESFQIPASGSDIYRCFVIPTSLPKDVYIAAIEYQPGNRRVVHHVLSYVDTSGEARKKDAADPGPGYACFSGPGVQITGDLGGWAPGNEPSRLPDGIGRALPKRADVVMQVHYQLSGKPETDRTRMGLFFSRTPVKQTLHWGGAAQLGLRVPAGESNVEAKADWEIPVDVVAYAVTPHMHLLGKDMTMWVTLPDGRRIDLVRIPEWDFSWQNSYYFDQPIDLPKGTALHVVAHYDNSENNPRNPNHPPKEVKWGEATTDEMCIGFIALTKKGQDLTRPGEKDDLLQIFMKQREQMHKKYEKEAERRAQEARAKKEGGK
jgi:hypothetical protein